MTARTCLLLTAFALGACASASKADALLISGVRVLGHEGMKDVRIEDGRIAAITESSSADAPQLRGEGGWLLPGFKDAHIHLYSGAVALEGADLQGLRSLAEVQAVLQEQAERGSPEDWVVGRGFAYDLGLGPEGPQAAMLDAVVPDRAVFLESYDGHAAWVNTKALALAGVVDETPNPAGGEIRRDAQGRATGFLLETAMALVEDRIPPAPLATKKRMVRDALLRLLALGLTEVEDMNADSSMFALYAELEAEGALPIKVVVSPPLDGSLDAYERYRAAHTGPMLRFGRLKGFVDGVVESKTAFLVAPYAGDTTRGEPRYTLEALTAKVREAAERGFSVTLHAVGDAAVRLALDAFERVPRRAGVVHRIEHIEVLHPDDHARFATLGVEASMQPYHANPFGDSPELGVWAQNLGADRLRYTFPWRSLVEAGATLRFGSDWPVMSAAPLWGLAVALTRQDAEGRPANGFVAEECLELERAIEAYSGRRSLEVGQVADLVLLHPQIDLHTPLTLHMTHGVQAVIVDGRLSWRAEGGAQKVPEVGLIK